MTYTICAACSKPLSPDDPDAVRAVELVKTAAMGPTVTYEEGPGVLFHTWCFPAGSQNYRRVDDAANA